MDELDKLTEKIIGCAIEVDRVLDPGMRESTYEAAVCIELADAGMNFQKQLVIRLYTKEGLSENIVLI
jgi:GxxExxY protein